MPREKVISPSNIRIGAFDIKCTNSYHARRTISSEPLMSVVIQYPRILQCIALCKNFSRYFTTFYPENRFWHFMQIVSTGDNLHEMSKHVFKENKKKYFNMMSAENFTQSANHQRCRPLLYANTQRENFLLKRPYKIRR